MFVVPENGNLFLYGGGAIIVVFVILLLCCLVMCIRRLCCKRKKVDPIASKELTVSGYLEQKKKLENQTIGASKELNEIDDPFNAASDGTMEAKMLRESKQHLQKEQAAAFKNPFKPEVQNRNKADFETHRPNMDDDEF